MANCDLCGREAELVDAIIEGSMMSVCLRCARHGNVVTIHQPLVNQRIERKASDDLILDSGEMIVNDFAERIKKGREMKGLRQEALAKAIGEKESVIHQLESRTLKPDLKLAKKLSFFLGIKLIEKAELTELKKQKSLNIKDKNVTIGDVFSKS